MEYVAWEMECRPDESWQCSRRIRVPRNLQQQREDKKRDGTEKRVPGGDSDGIRGESAVCDGDGEVEREVLMAMSREGEVKLEIARRKRWVCDGSGLARQYKRGSRGHVISTRGSATLRLLR